MKRFGLDLLTQTDRPLQHAEAEAIASALANPQNWQDANAPSAYAFLLLRLAQYHTLATFKSLWDRYLSKIEENQRYAPFATTTDGVDGWYDDQVNPDVFAMYQHIEAGAKGHASISAIINFSDPCPTGTLKAYCRNHPLAGFMHVNVPGNRDYDQNYYQDHSSYAEDGEVYAPHYNIFPLIQLASGDPTVTSPTCFLWAQGVDLFLFSCFDVKTSLRQHQHHPIANRSPKTKDYQQTLAILRQLFAASKQIKSPDDDYTFADLQTDTGLLKSAPARCLRWLRTAISSEAVFLYGVNAYKAMLRLAQPHPQSHQREQMMVDLGYTPHAFTVDHKTYVSANALLCGMEASLHAARGTLKTRLSYQLGLLVATLGQAPGDTPEQLLQQCANGLQQENKRIATQILQLAECTASAGALAANAFKQHYQRCVSTCQLEQPSLYLDVIMACHVAQQYKDPHDLSTGVDRLRLLTEYVANLLAPLPPQLAGLPSLKLNPQATPVGIKTLRRYSDLAQGLLQSLWQQQHGRFIALPYLQRVHEHINAALQRRTLPDVAYYPEPSASPAEIKTLDFMLFCHQMAHAEGASSLADEQILNYLPAFVGFNPLAQHKKIHALVYSDNHYRKTMLHYGLCLFFITNDDLLEGDERKSMCLSLQPFQAKYFKNGMRHLARERQYYELMLPLLEARQVSVALVKASMQVYLQQLEQVDDSEITEIVAFCQALFSMRKPDIRIPAKGIAGVFIAISKLYDFFKVCDDESHPAHAAWHKLITAYNHAGEAEVEGLSKKLLSLIAMDNQYGFGSLANWGTTEISLVTLHLQHEIATQGQPVRPSARFI